MGRPDGLRFVAYFEFFPCRRSAALEISSPRKSRLKFLSQHQRIEKRNLPGEYSWLRFSPRAGSRPGPLDPRAGKHQGPEGHYGRRTNGKPRVARRHGSAPPATRAGPGRPVGGDQEALARCHRPPGPCDAASRTSGIPIVDFLMVYGCHIHVISCHMTI